MTVDNSQNELLKKIKALEKEAAARKIAEAQLKKQSGFLNSVLESLSHPFYVVDANDYSIKLANSAALKSGVSGESTCHALTHKRDTPCNSTEHPCPLEIIKRTLVSGEDALGGVWGRPLKYCFTKINLNDTQMICHAKPA